MQQNFSDGGGNGWLEDRFKTVQRGLPQYKKVYKARRSKTFLASYDYAISEDLEDADLYKRKVINNFFLTWSLFIGRG